MKKGMTWLQECALRNPKAEKEYAIALLDAGTKDIKAALDSYATLTTFPANMGETRAKFDKVAYQREYMRKRRARCTK